MFKNVILRIFTNNFSIIFIFLIDKFEKKNIPPNDVKRKQRIIQTSQLRNLHRILHLLLIMNSGKSL